MRIALMVAAAQNGVIGRDNQLPWRLPEDLRYFKKTTMGKPIIMGRRTFDSIGRPLPGRTNIVISRQQSPGLPEAVLVTQSAAEALELARAQCAKDGVDETVVIGGGQVYKLFMLQASRLYLTRVHADVAGDAHFFYDEGDWHLISEERYQASGDNPYDYSFCILEKTTD